MATTVSHAMRRFPASPPDNKFNNFNNFNPTQNNSPTGTQCSSTTSSGSALSRSMRYAEPWLYGSVRGAPVLLVQPVPVVPLCSCQEYLCGTSNGKSSKHSTCKKCKGTRIAIGQTGGKTKFGTVRGYSTSTPSPTLTSVRAGTVRVTNSSSRPSILPPSPTIDPYDLMRRSRLSCPDVGSQFRTRSKSPNKSSKNYSLSRVKNSNRSPSPGKSILQGRRSILECDVNPYDLVSTDEDKKEKSLVNGKSKGKNHLLDSDYEDVDTTSVKKLSHIPKLQPKSAKKQNTIRKTNEREINVMRNEAKFKSILKKPSQTFNDTDTSLSVTDTPSPKSGSHFYLPLPTLSPPRKKVQFLVETEGDAEPLGPQENNDGKKDIGRGREDLDSKESAESESSVATDEEYDEPCRLKRSLSERLGQNTSYISFNDTMALRNSRSRPGLSDSNGPTLFEAVTDLQRLDGIGPTRPRPREPPPPPPPPSSSPVPSQDRPATPPARSETELGGGFEVTTVTEPTKLISEQKQTINVSKKEEDKDLSVQNKLSEHQTKEPNDDYKEENDTPPSVPPRKRSNSKQPTNNQIVDKKENVLVQKEALTDKSVAINHNNNNANANDNKNQTRILSNIEIVKEDNIIEIKETNTNESELSKFETPKTTLFSENISSTKIENSDLNYSYQKVKIEPSKTIVQISSPNMQIIPSTVHRLQIKNEFEDNNYNKNAISENAQRKTSILINGDDCYSTVNVNDDVPIYQSSVVVNDYDSSKIEINTSSKSSSVYITGDFQITSTPINNSEEKPKKTLVILEGTFSAPSTPSPTILNGQSTFEMGKTFVVLQENQENCQETLNQNESNTDVQENDQQSEEKSEKPSFEELQRLLKDPVEAVKRNLVPHVCGKADVERKPKNKKPVTSNSLVARLLEDPFLGSLAEGLETNAVAKLIEDSLLKLRQDFQEEDKDACSENESCPAYELMEAGSDCYSNHSNRSSVTEDELGTRSKFYQLLADAALQEIEDHHYECIKPNVDPIYEEIEIPPPLPNNPPPSVVIEDLQTDSQYTTRSIFEGASKYDILSYLVDAKERGIVPEESYTYNFNNSGEVIVEEEVPKSRVFSSRVSHMSTVSDSSEDSSLVTVEKNGPQKSAEVERNDSGVGSETSKCSRSRYRNQPEISLICEDCDLPLESQIEEDLLVCKKCSKKRSERKETITEIVETEEKYSRDLQIILEEFYQPMLVAGLLTPEQLSAIFLNVEELLENSQALAERLRDTLEIAQEQGDEDLLTVNIGKIFLEAAPMLHAFETYCVRQGPASLLLAGLEKEKELLRIFLRVSQMENTVLRRMNLNSFLMVPVQRVTKYPLLLARLHKVTPPHHDSRELLKEAQHKIELHLNHMNSETKDIPSKLWRRISNNSGRRSSSEMDLVNIKLRKIAVDVLEWNHDEARFALEGRLLFTQPTDNNWRKGRTIKLSPVNALLVTNGKPNPSTKSDRNSTSLSNSSNNSLLPNTDDNTLTFPRHTGVREAALLLVRDKGGRYSLLREPLYLDRCVIATDPAWQSYFEVQELLSKDTFIFKAEDPEMTGTWYRQLQYHAQGKGAWRKRRNALANIMINGMGSRS